MVCKNLKLAYLTLTVLAVSASLGYSQDQKDLTRQEITAIVDTCLAAFKTYYIYPDVVFEIEKHIKQKIKEGHYSEKTNLYDLTKMIKKDFRDVAKDRHIWIDIMENIPITNKAVTREKVINEKRKTNFGFVEFKFLQGNIAYLRIDGFNDVEYARETAAHAMGLLANSSSVILDLRNNHGGYGNMVHFISSYFFEKRTQLTSLYFRKADSLVEAWTDPFVPGKKLLKQKVFILTSQNTASAAEAFTYSMKHYKRAVVVGEQSRGAAHWNETYKFPDLGIFLEIPVARPINPVTKKDWQGHGVQPEIKVPAKEALDTAVKLALEKN